MPAYFSVKLWSAGTTRARTSVSRVKEAMAARSQQSPDGVKGHEVESTPAQFHFRHKTCLYIILNNVYAPYLHKCLKGTHLYTPKGALFYF